MTDTIDRLVRMLDDERAGRRIERERTSQMAQSLMHEQTAHRREAADAKAARLKIEELEQWIDNLHHQVPPAKRSGWAKRPTKFDDSPF